MVTRTAGLLVSATLGLMLASASAHAFIRDRQIDEARLCTQHFPTNERLNGIPTHLLAAIASSESGRWNDTLGMVIPWPWTINAEGKGYYFESKEEAIAKVRQLQAQGMRSIDVGCMQVNLKHHPRAFANLEQAFDPKYNVSYAARFLRTNYNDLHSWTKATAAYHSRTPIYGNRYLAQIEKAWNTIVGKLRMARANAGGDVVRAADAREEQEFAALQREFESRERLPLSDVQVRGPQPRQSAKVARPRNSMKIITVRDAPASSRGQTMVVRPQISGEDPVKLQAEQAEVTPVALQADSGEALQEVAMANPTLVNANSLVMQFGSKQVTNHVASANTSVKSGAKTGPKFVFVE